MPKSKKTTRRTLTQRDRRMTSAARRTLRFEQLEGRAMLSANIGPSFYGPSIFVMDVQGYGKPQMPPAVIFAPANFDMRVAGLPGWDGRVGDSNFGGRPGDIDRMQELGFGYTMSANESQSLQKSAYSARSNNQSTTTTIVTLQIQQIVFYVEPVTTMPAFHAVKDSQPPLGPPPQGNQGQRLDLPNDPLATFFYKDPEVREYGMPGKEPGGAALPYAGVVAASVSTQSATHGVEPSNFLSTSALDAALQSYTSQLLLVSGSVSSQAVVNTVKDSSLSTTGDTDDFVPLSDIRVTPDQASKTDVLSRQETAVEDVLKSLQDDDSLPSDSQELATSHDGSQSSDQNAQVADYIFGAAYDVAVANGGMILLQTNGDANESPVNLARVAESHPDMFSPHLGVEASVGFYQAVDRGIEELSTVEPAPTTSPVAAPTPAKSEHRYSSNAGGSSRKAAGVLAASTLAGGLLWVTGRKQLDARDTESRAKCRPAI